jgi:hypothetical protein
MASFILDAVAASATIKGNRKSITLIFFQALEDLP